VDTIAASRTRIVDKAIEAIHAVPYVSHRPEGSAKGIGKFRSPTEEQVPGAQPEIASKAVRGGTEDRLHDPDTVFEAVAGTGSRSLGSFSFLFSSVATQAPYPL
jgi:hypothetical protein